MRKKERIRKATDTTVPTLRCRTNGVSDAQCSMRSARDTYILFDHVTFGYAVRTAC